VDAEQKTQGRAAAEPEFLTDEMEMGRSSWHNGFAINAL
jgi:hypothetical protein